MTRKRGTPKVWDHPQGLGTWSEGLARKAECARLQQRLEERIPGASVAEAHDREITIRISRVDLDAWLATVPLGQR